MKSFLTITAVYFFVLTAFHVKAQPIVLHENFETVDSFISGGVPAWFQQSGLYVSGTHCFRDTLAINSTTYLTSSAFSTTGDTYILLDFWHICKIPFFDEATIEISINNGTTWTQLTAAEYLGYSGFSANNLFTSASYGPTASGWGPSNDHAQPTNSWWKHENFDISSLASNTAQVKIRFKLKDLTGNGNSGNYGWLIDDVSVNASPHEVTPPTIAWSPPEPAGQVYSFGPFNIKDTIVDASGVDSATLFYSVNGGAVVPVSMTHMSGGNLWSGQIPAISLGETVCYYVQATDIWGNTAVLPDTGENCFVHEITPPAIAWATPEMTGQVYSLGPFNILDTIVDASGVDSATLYYSVNGGVDLPVYMVHIPGGNLWTGQIPPCNNGDTVCYYVQATDIWGNSATLPDTGENCFVVLSPLATAPYCENFDVFTGYWTAFTLSGSGWQLSTPAYGSLNSPHSLPYSWNVGSVSGYQYNTNTTLTSPVIDFSNVTNPVISFWLNYNTAAFQDGFHMEYSDDLGFTWHIMTIKDDPRAVNWYSMDSLYSGVPPSWNGSSPGWIHCIYHPGCNLAGSVQFRFIFISTSFTTGDGVSFDDFCIYDSPANDIGITSVIAPTAIPAGDTVFVKVRLADFGSAAASGFNIGYSVNGGTVTNQMFSATLQPCAADTFTFATPFICPPGIYSLCVFTALTGDLNTSNDTLCESLLGIPTFSLPYLDGFNSPSSYWHDSSATADTHWQLGVPAYGSTSSVHSAPYAWDINLNTSYNNQAYSVLFSPFFDFRGVYGANLSCWLNCSTEMNRDGTRLEYTLDAGNTWNVLGTVNDPLATNWYNSPSLSSSSLPGWSYSNGWQQSSYKLRGVPGMNNCQLPVMFRFIFTSDYSITDDGISMDDFKISLPPSQDVGISDLLISGTQLLGQMDSVRAIVTNYGSGSASNFTIVLLKDAVAIDAVLFTNTLPPGSSDTILFSVPFQVTQGTFMICSTTQLINDSDATNDMVCHMLYGDQLLSLPYSENFDFSGGWHNSSADTLTRWEYGTPAYDLTTGAHSAPNCWDVNLNRAYGNNANCYLVSPVFDFSGLTARQFNQITLSFWQNRYTENNFDGVRFEYSTDFGSSWNLLGSVNDSNAFNWYTDTSFISFLPQWSGLSAGSSGLQGWQQSGYTHLPSVFLGNLVKFRFVFTSDNAGTLDGISMDDFSINLPLQYDAAVTSIIQPRAIEASGITENVQIEIQNQGYDTISNFQVAYKIDNGPVSTASYPGTLLAGASDTVTFSATFVTPNTDFNICAWVSANDLNPFNDTICKAVIVGNYLFHEDFEIPDSMTSFGVAPWFPETAYHTNGTQCMRDTVSINGTAHLTSDAFSTIGYPHILFTFDQVCKISTADRGKIEISTNNGNSWSPVSWNSYLGTSPAFHAAGYFNAGAYGQTWQPAIDTAIPQSGWWKNELFDLTSIAANYSQVKIGFALSDGNGNGRSGNYGWMIDNVKVLGSSSTILGNPSLQPDRPELFFPNPSRGIFSLQKSKHLKDNAVISVMDPLGNEIRRKLMIGADLITLDISDQPAGIYFVRILSGDEVITQHIVICR